MGNQENEQLQKQLEDVRAEVTALQKENRKLNRKIAAQEELAVRARAASEAKSNLAAAITAEKSKQEKFLNLLLEYSPDIIVMTDIDGRIVYSTKAFLNATELPNPGMVNGRRIDEIFTAEHFAPYVDQVLAIFQKVIHENVSQVHELTLALGTGEPRSYTMYLSPMLSETGTPEGSIAILHDNTELIYERDRAEAANHAKTAFLAKMSHEIRTPMNAIVGMCELILREELSPVVFGHAMNIKQASANLLSIINDILDLSKIESGKLEIINSHYLFSSVVNDAVNVIRMRLIEKPIRLLVYVDPNIPNQLNGDEVRVRQIIMNLLSNAAKYTHDGFIELSITYERTDEKNLLLHINVRDSGIGIRGKDMDKLFSEFVQISSAGTKGIEGTGLGLTISKSLCVEMGGDLTAQSEFGVGSTFTADIPQQIVSEEPLAQIRHMQDKNVLLYEMREACGKSIMQSLQALGIPCTWATKQSEFFEAFLETTMPYSHVLLPQVLLSSATKVIEKMDDPPLLIAIVDYGAELLNQEIPAIPMPVYTITLANMLNDENSTSNFDEVRSETRFIAPSARILLVDDIITNLTVAEGLLMPYEMQIDTCKSGDDAVKLVQQNRYDIVFMDHMMPGMDGIEATTLIRNMGEQDEYFAKLPIIALTANAVSGMKEMFLSNGMDDYLAKPIDTSKLDNILDRWLPAEKKQKASAHHKKEKALVMSIEGVDTKLGLSMTGGIPSHYIRVLKNFHSDGREKIAEIQKAYDSQNYTLYATYVHALKSASASIGATALSQKAKALEFAAKSEDVEFLKQNNASFLRALENILENLGKALDQLEKEKRGTQQANPMLREILTQLQRALDEIDTPFIDAAVNEISAGNWDAETQKALDRIFQQIILAEYEEAIEDIDKLLTRL